MPHQCFTRYTLYRILDLSYKLWSIYIMYGVWTNCGIGMEGSRCGLWPAAILATAVLAAASNLQLFQVNDVVFIRHKLISYDHVTFGHEAQEIHWPLGLNNMEGKKTCFIATWSWCKLLSKFLVAELLKSKTDNLSNVRKPITTINTLLDLTFSPWTDVSFLPCGQVQCFRNCVEASTVPSSALVLGRKVTLAMDCRWCAGSLLFWKTWSNECLIFSLGMVPGRSSLSLAGPKGSKQASNTLTCNPLYDRVIAIMYI